MNKGIKAALALGLCCVTAARGVGGEKALPLAQEQRIGAHAGANQLGG